MRRFYKPVCVVFTFTNAYLIATRLLYIPVPQPSKDTVDLFIVDSDYTACEIYDLRDVFTIREVKGLPKANLLGKQLNKTKVYQVTMDPKVSTETVIRSGI